MPVAAVSAVFAGLLGEVATVAVALAVLVEAGLVALAVVPVEAALNRQG